MLEAFFTILYFGIPLFVISSVVLYIRKRLGAKEEGRVVNRAYTVMLAISLFIVGMVLFGIYVIEHDPAVQETRISYDTQLADSVHAAVLMAMSDQQIAGKKEYKEDLETLKNETDITQFHENENCILDGAAGILGVKDMHELRGKIRSKGATGSILVKVYGIDQVQVVIEGTDNGLNGEEIMIR
ncbi:MAG: hypothetical protein K6B28_09105 [Lachnospiraceae bacterium]|nr:hypothetical protein [Lachnospiraceae bacterium]